MSGQTLGHYDPYDFSDNSDSDEEYYYDHGLKLEDEDVDMDRDDEESHHSFMTGSSAIGSSVPSAVSFRAMTEASHQSSYTSYDRSEGDEGSRSASPASVISMTESIRTHMYRQEHGRNLNNYSEVYKLPADDEEWHRLGMCTLPSVSIL